MLDAFSPLNTLCDRRQPCLNIFGLTAYAGTLDARPMMKKRESVISTAATMRVLNVLKHWVSKHQQVTPDL